MCSMLGGYEHCRGLGRNFTTGPDEHIYRSVMPKPMVFGMSLSWALGPECSFLGPLGPHICQQEPCLFRVFGFGQRCIEPMGASTQI